MQVRVKLMGVLKEKMPEGGALELADGATIEDALQTLEIPHESVHIISVNGSFERDFGRTLEPDDEITVLAPVGAG